MSQSPFFSVIIPALNEARYLPLLLKDLIKQTNQDFEVLVVDGNSSDKTVSLAQTYAERLKLTCLSTPANVNAQRNQGARQAQGKWLLFMDADNRLPTFFLQGLRYQIDKHPRLDLFSCWMDSKAYERNDRPIIDLFNVGMELYSKVAPVAPGAMIGAKRQVFTKVRFDQDVALSEDHLFLQTCKQKGFTFGYFREPRYTFSLRRFKKEGNLKMLRNYATAQLLFLTNNKRITQPLDTYPMNGGTYYDTKRSPSYLQIIQQFFAKASKSQLNQAKKIVSLIQELSI